METAPVPEGANAARPRRGALRSLGPGPRAVTLSDLASEPYRLLFPLALLAGVLGVALWPMHVWGLHPAYPGLEHARLMAIGLFGGFVLGFLGTVIPRLTGATYMGLPTLFALCGLHAAMVGAWAAGNQLAGDVLALLLLIGFAAWMVSRVRRRTSDPPAAFVLVALAFLCAIAGALLAVGLDLGLIEGAWARLQRLLSYQGFVLLPILGVGAFLLPGFFGADAGNHFSPSMLMPGAHQREAMRILAIGLLIVVSFLLEAAGWPRVGHGLRVMALALFLWLHLPIYRGGGRPGTMGTLLRIAVACILVGYACISLWPELRTGWLHVTLIAGFALLTLVVAARVCLSHGGAKAELAGRLGWLRWTAGILLFAAATRLSADLWPQVRSSHYAYGAIVWLIGIAVWARWILPTLRRTA